jgi:hypothetical protein
VETQIVTYSVNDSMTAMFEIEPTAGFIPAGPPEQVIGRVKAAVGPAVEAARVVLERVKEVGPDQAAVTFGIKVSGGADWLVARAAGEGSFEITLTWSRDTGRRTASVESPANADTAAASTSGIQSETGASEGASGGAGGA